MKCPYFFKTKTCPNCKWPFQCPLTLEQENRLYCTACESQGAGALWGRKR